MDDNGGLCQMEGALNVDVLSQKTNGPKLSTRSPNGVLGGGGVVDQSALCKPCTASKEALAPL